MGKPYIIKHCKTQGHLDKAKPLKSQARLTVSSPSTSNEVLKTSEAEVRMTVLAASCNLQLAFHDQLSPDSNIA